MKRNVCIFDVNVFVLFCIAKKLFSFLVSNSMPKIAKWIFFFLCYRLAGFTYILVCPIMKLFWKIRNLSFCRKIFEHCRFDLNFPLVPGMLSKIQSNPFTFIFLQYFSKNLRIHILSLFSKILNIAILFKISPRFQKCLWKFNQTLLHWATRFFFFI